MYALNERFDFSSDFANRLRRVVPSYDPNIVIVHFGYAYHHHHESFIEGLQYLKKQCPRADYHATGSGRYMIPEEEMLHWCAEVHRGGWGYDWLDQLLRQADPED